VVREDERSIAIRYCQFKKHVEETIGEPRIASLLNDAAG
jgi:hypothetical protein